jgi:hypothetical protein
MSPRIILETECIHGEYEQYYSGRGLLSGTYICRHSENEGCVCLHGPEGEECVLFCTEDAVSEEKEKAQA